MRLTPDRVRRKLLLAVGKRVSWSIVLAGPPLAGWAPLRRNTGERIWLRVSSLVRRLHLEVLLPLLPGVRQHPGDEREIRVNPRVARYIVLKIFHLFGYRKCPPQGGYLVFRRRPERWLV